MRSQAFGAGPQRGGALLAVLVLLGLLAAVTASLVGVSLAEARAQAENETVHRAMYLAESGLEAARYEIAEQVDPDGDGMGTVSVQASTWSYNVSAESLGGNRWRLTSVGENSGTRRTLQTVIGTLLTTRFPAGAISIVGDFDETDKLKFKFKKSADLSIVSPDTAAITLISQSAAEFFGEKFAESIAKKSIPPQNFSGSITNTFDLDGKLAKKSPDGAGQVNLPIAYEDSFPPELRSLDGMYQKLVENVNGQISYAETVTTLPGRDSSFGSKSQPAIVYMPSKIDVGSGQSISGHGTLIVHELNVKDGGLVDWNGNVVIIGNERKKAQLEVIDSGSAFKVRGNLLVMGEGKEDAELRIKKEAVVTVDGSMFLGTQANEAKGRKAKLEVDGRSLLDIHGVMLLLGQKIDLKVKSDAELRIEGTMLLSLAEGEKKEQLKLELDGRLDVRKDDVSIQAGMTAWSALGDDLGVPEARVITKVTGAVVQNWKVIP